MRATSGWRPSMRARWWNAAIKTAYWRQSLFMTSSYHCRLHKIVVEQFGWVHTALNFMPKSVKKKNLSKQKYFPGREPSYPDSFHATTERWGPLPSWTQSCKSIPTIGKALKYHSRTPTGKLVSNVQYSSLPTSSKTVVEMYGLGPSATDCCTILPPPEKSRP